MIENYITLRSTQFQIYFVIWVFPLPSSLAVKTFQIGPFNSLLPTIKVLWFSSANKRGLNVIWILHKYVYVFVIFVPAPLNFIFIWFSVVYINFYFWNIRILIIRIL